MPLQLLPAGETDIPQAVEVERAAYGPNKLEPILFPGPLPQETHTKRADDLIQQYRDDTTTKWLKVVDTETGDSIAFASWHIYEQRPMPKPHREFGPGCNVEACEMFFHGLERQRERLMSHRPYIYLHMLHTDPKHQRRGAGGMLIKWGLAEGDRQNLPCFLEATEEGRPLYVRHGFQDVEELVADFSKWGMDEPHRTWAMIREPTARA